MERISLESVDQLNALTASKSNVLLVVSRNNCPGCDTLQRALDAHTELQTALDGVTVAVAKVEKMPNITQVFGLRQAPTTILFKDDDEVGRVHGFQLPTLVELLQRFFSPLPIAA